MDKGNLIKNALVSKNQKNEKWFSNIRNCILGSHINPKVDFDKLVDEWITECEIHKTTSIKDEILKLSEQLTT